MDINYTSPQRGPSQEEEQATKQKRHDHIGKWFARIDDAREYRKKMASSYEWESIVREFHGEFDWAKFGMTDIYIPPLNLTFAYVQSEVPSLYLRDPHIKINPKNLKSVPAAKIAEASVNYVWRHNRIKRENTKNVQDGLLVGHSWFKTGYSGEFGSVEDANGNTFEFVEKDNFFGYRLPWDAVLFNPDALDPPYDCKWIVHEVWAPLEEVKTNPLYQNTANLKASNLTGDAQRVDGQSSKNAYKPKEEMACLYEVWDKKTMTVFTIAPGMFEYLREPQPWPYEMRGFPFSFLCFNPSPIQPFGIPDVYTFRPQVIELMKIRAQMYDHIKRFNRQYLVKKNAISEEAMAQLKQGATGAIVEVEGEITDVQVLAYPALQTDIYNVEVKVKEDMINISGQSPQERGATQQTSTRTFRELAQIRRGAENRRSRKVDTVEAFVEDIAGNLLALLQQFADVPFYVKTTGEEYAAIEEALRARASFGSPDSITGPEGFTFTKEDIQGEFDLECVAGSTVPLDKEVTMDVIMQLIPQLQGLGAQPGGPVAATIGNLIAENLDIPQLTAGIKAEGELQAQQRQAAAQQAQEQSEMLATESASKLQLDAEKVGIKQNELLLKSIQVHNEAQQPNKKKVEGE